MASSNDTGDVFLLVSGCVRARGRLTDASDLRAILRELPPLVGMRALHEPVVHVATNNPGLEGYVPIDLSNITVSTYTNPPRVVACIHSCQGFEVEAALDFIKNAFACDVIRSAIVREGDLK